MSAPALTLPCPHPDCHEVVVLDRTSYADALASGTARVRYAGLAGHGHDRWIDLVPADAHAPGCYSYLNPTEAGRHRVSRQPHSPRAQNARIRVQAMLLARCTIREIVRTLRVSSRTVGDVKVEMAAMTKGATP